MDHRVKPGDDRIKPPPAAFLRQARCTAQVQPGGWEATSLAGTAAGAWVGMASFTARSAADWSCAGM